MCTLANKRRRPQSSAGFLIPALLVLAGCSVGPDFVRPEQPSAQHYNAGGDPGATIAVDGKPQRFDGNVEPVARWWQLFASPQLDEAVAQGIAGNPGLKAAQASLQQSQENLRAGYGIFYPQVNAAFGLSREKFSPALFGSSAAGSTFNLTTLSASVSYALDIFGAQRRTVEGLAAQVDLQRSETVGTYLILSGNLVNTLIAASAYQAQITETERLVDLQKEQVAIAQSQYQAGMVAYAVVLGMQTQLAALESALPALRQRLAQSEHLLATLEGKAPSEWQMPSIAFDAISLPRQLPLSLPSQLVRQRPDILAAEAQLHVASANIGVATAALFPSFTLNASYGQNSTTTSRLFASNGNFWNLGLDAAAPLFNGGTLLARRDAAKAAYQQTLSSYRETVLAAFAQVADSIRALEHDAEMTEVQERQESASKSSLDLAKVNYEAGLVNYVQVLAADIQYRQARIALLQARAQHLQDTSALFVALGGGWWNAPETADLRVK
jgi:NodT family efflux transporter outer membrane factor (OMF) lipoprotein